MLCCAEAFATYIDVGRFMLVLIRVAPGPNNALTVSGLLWAKTVL